jgi:hypothetical protein
MSGKWRLVRNRSDIRDLSVPPVRFLRLDQSATELSIAMSEPEGDVGVLVCPLDGSSRKNLIGKATWNVVSKWEGRALLLNIIVTGPPDFSLFERWSRAEDGSGRLVVTRNVIRPDGETESTFVYEDAALPALPMASPAPNPAAETARRTPPTAARPDGVVVASGTRILMRLTNPVNTKRTVAGDRVYLQTAVPIFVDGRLVIPRDSYVTGTVTEAQRAGRIKGKSALNLRFESVTLPNGTTKDFRARADSVDSQGNLDRNEGRIEGEGKGGSGTKRVAQTTAAGAGLGTIVGAATGHAASGLGIGAAAGAAAGLASVFGTRGADVVIPQGTTVEMVLDRDLVFTDEELRRRVQ